MLGNEAAKQLRP